MQKLWLITNPASGSATSDKRDAIEAAVAEAGLSMVGRTMFPDDPLPEPATLTAAGAEVVLLFAGDGTINAAACALDGWDGTALILPGGTMNMLSKRLHRDRPGAEIVHDFAKNGGDRRHLAYVESEGHRAFVAMIAGPAAAWSHTREAVRAGSRWAAIGRAARFAFRRTLRDGVRIDGGRRGREHQAVVVIPEDDALEVAAIGLSGVMDAVRLGVVWLASDWRQARGVAVSRRQSVTLRGNRAIHALFDGESVKLADPMRVTHGRTKLAFIATTDPALGDKEEGRRQGP